jgi:predicted secreted Zn-dependent protease
MEIIYKHLILCVPLPKRLEHRGRVFNEYVWENEKQHTDINENMVNKIKNIIIG